MDAGIAWLTSVHHGNKRLSKLTPLIKGFSFSWREDTSERHAAGEKHRGQKSHGEVAAVLNHSTENTKLTLSMPRVTFTPGFRTYMGTRLQLVPSTLAPLVPGYIAWRLGIAVAARFQTFPIPYLISALVPYTSSGGYAFRKEVPERWSNLARRSLNGHSFAAKARATR